MTIWLLIAFSACTAFAFRALPFAFKNSSALTQTQGSFYRFISYSAQAMLGVIIYDTAFNKMDALTLIQQFQILDALKLFLLVGTFIAVAKTKKILPAFFASLLIYVTAFAYLNG
ncbi:AzlD domain-containing protein [Pseudomonas violetae]|jgi:branched-subunit amino acid transport protein|uniref:AzlD domain-containing protein n=1 Tax=Pseudomonas violetae TaxID=2915813 RepID=A0ABT0EYP1_9PSED|nr:AzlD domain-containing protein [Pseudomonas violetae]MCK1790825.1 AzlD domain-containing protein [Pseudomonas violetae]